MTLLGIQQFGKGLVVMIHRYGQYMTTFAIINDTITWQVRYKASTIFHLSNLLGNTLYSRTTSGNCNINKCRCVNSEQFLFKILLHKHSYRPCGSVCGIKTWTDSRFLANTGSEKKTQKQPHDPQQIANQNTTAVTSVSP